MILYSSDTIIIILENNSDRIIVFNDRLVIFRKLANNGTFMTIICNNIEPIIVNITNGLLKSEVVKILFFSLLQFRTCMFWINTIISITILLDSRILILLSIRYFQTVNIIKDMVNPNIKTSVISDLLNNDSSVFLGGSVIISLVPFSNDKAIS